MSIGGLREGSHMQKRLNADLVKFDSAKSLMFPVGVIIRSPLIVVKGIPEH